MPRTESSAGSNSGSYGGLMAAYVEANSVDGSRVEARAAAAGGTASYSFLWAGSNPGTFAERGEAVSYEPVTRDLREVIPAQSLARIEHVSVTVVDANGVSAQVCDVSAETPCAEFHKPFPRKRALTRRG